VVGTLRAPGVTCTETQVFVLMLPFVPESPIFHIRRGNEDKAKKCLLKLYGTAPGYDVDHEYRVILEQMEAERAITQAGGKSSFFEIFQGANLRRTIAGVVGAASQPLAGAPLLFSYSTYYFSIVGVKDPFLVTVIV
jgi:SP family general alpha glucoside:H+ symporter-like MFS transporter